MHVLECHAWMQKAACMQRKPRPSRILLRPPHPMPHACMQVVNAMIDVFQTEAGRLASDYGLAPLLGAHELPADVPVRLSERMDLVRILLQRMTEELLVAEAERRCARACERERGRSYTCMHAWCMLGATGVGWTTSCACKHMHAAQVQGTLPLAPACLAYRVWMLDLVHGAACTAR